MDTSALAKLYVRELGTERMLSLASRTASNQLAVLALSQVEIRSAIRRRERSGEISQTIADQLVASFERHLESRFLRQVVTDAILDAACNLIDKHGLTALDAIQLSGYLALRTSSGINVPTFVSADRELLDAAQAESVPVIDPCSG
jgi:uncharacterized protein